MTEMFISTGIMTVTIVANAFVVSLFFFFFFLFRYFRRNYTIVQSHGRRYGISSFISTFHIATQHSQCKWLYCKCLRLYLM